MNHSIITGIRSVDAWDWGEVERWAGNLQRDRQGDGCVIILISLVDSQVYMCVKTHDIVHFKYVLFIAYQVYPSKAIH